MLKTMASMVTCIALSVLLGRACTARAHSSRLAEIVLDLPVSNAGWNAGLTKPLYMSGYFKVHPIRSLHPALTKLAACTITLSVSREFPDAA